MERKTGIKVRRMRFSVLKSSGNRMVRKRKRDDQEIELLRYHGILAKEFFRLTLLYYHGGDEGEKQEKSGDYPKELKAVRHLMNVTDFDPDRFIDRWERRKKEQMRLDEGTERW